MNRSILWDCHMHSSFSADSSTPMENMIISAIERGMNGICFTEHHDPDCPVSPEGLDFLLDIPAYKEQLFSLKEKFADKIQIRFGIEIGLMPHLKHCFQTLTEQEPFDFVIGSSHVVHGIDPYYPEFYERRSEFQCYMEYFESILENLSVIHSMDVYGHLDYIVRYGPHKNQEYSFGRYQDILDEILKTLVEKGIGIELNTGGYHYGLGEPNPCCAVIRRYRQLGGEIITVGADAHTPERIGSSFDRAASVLKECGFSYYTVFKERKPEFIKL